MLVPLLRTLLTPRELHAVQTALLPLQTSSQVVVGMSGGVDSSVSALMARSLLPRTTRVVGVWMSNWNVDGQQCERDFEDVKHVCGLLDMECRRVDLSKEYWHKVWQPCLDSYERGLSPNPDVWCNKEIKFGAFQDLLLKQFNSSKLITGHYAQISNTGQLLRAVDSNKDQSYFLCMVPSFAQACFPLGGLLKTRVREIAMGAGLGARIGKRKDSVGVCFVGESSNGFGAFLEDYLANPQGEFVCKDTGHFLGYHDGLLNFTTGQRARIAGLKSAYYVVDKDVMTRTVYVSQGKTNPWLFTDTLRIGGVFFRGSSGEVVVPTSRTMKVRAQINSRGEASQVESELDIFEGKEGEIRFSSKVRRAGKGQVVGLYADDKLQCLGGGVVI